MKLAFVIKTLGSRGGVGGAERVLSILASELSQRGHQLTVVSYDRPHDPDFFGFPAGVERIRLGAGSTHEPARPVETALRISALRRTMARVRPDVAVGFMHSAYVPLGLALMGSRTRVVASEHMPYLYYRERRLERLLVKLTAPTFAAITTPCLNIQRGFPHALRERMVAIANPVPPAPAAADPVGGERKILLAVGRLAPQKDHHTLLQAFALVARKHADWDLRIIGEGALRPVLEARIDKLGLQERVALPGVTSHVSREYQHAQLFVMSSRYESFGLTTAEALSHGLPAIGFADCHGTNQLIDHDRNGLLARGADRVGALAETLDSMMACAETRARFGRQGPASTFAYRPDLVAVRWEEVLASAADGGTRRNRAAD